MNEDERKLMDLAMEWTLTAMKMSIEPEIKEQIIHESVQNQTVIDSPGTS